MDISELHHASMSCPPTNRATWVFQYFKMLELLYDEPEPFISRFTPIFNFNRIQPGFESFSIRYQPIQDSGPYGLYKAAPEVESS